MSDARMQRLVEQREKLNAKIARQRARAESAARKRDTRRKIVVGAAVLAAAERDEAVRAWLDPLLDQVVTRPHDREVLGLPNGPVA